MGCRQKAKHSPGEEKCSEHLRRASRLAGFPLPRSQESGPSAEGWQQGGGTDGLGSCSPSSSEEGSAQRAAMWGFQGGSRLLATMLRAPRVPRAGVTSKPPEHPISAGVSSLWGGKKKIKINQVGGGEVAGDSLGIGIQTQIFAGN